MARVPRRGGRALATPGAVRRRWWRWRQHRAAASGARARRGGAAPETPAAHLPPLSQSDMREARASPGHPAEVPASVAAATVGSAVARGRSYGRGLTVDAHGSAKAYIRWPRLHYASLHGQIEDVKDCLREGHDIDEGASPPPLPPRPRSQGTQRCMRVRLTAGFVLLSRHDEDGRGARRRTCIGAVPRGPVRPRPRRQAPDRPRRAARVPAQLLAEPFLLPSERGPHHGPHLLLARPEDARAESAAPLAGRRRPCEFLPPVELPLKRSLVAAPYSCVLINPSCGSFLHSELPSPSSASTFSIVSRCAVAGASRGRRRSSYPALQLRLPHLQQTLALCAPRGLGVLYAQLVLQEAAQTLENSFGVGACGVVARGGHLNSTEDSLTWGT